MNTFKPEDSVAVRCRSRWEYEDGLLNVRTTIFLGFNGLAAIAFGLNLNSYERLALSAFFFAVSMLWVVCACQSLRVIRSLARWYLKSCPDDEIEKLVQRTLGGRHRLRPTNIIAFYLPLLVMVGWVLGAFKSLSAIL